MNQELRKLIETIARIPAPTGKEQARAEYLRRYLTAIPSRTDPAGNLWVFPTGEADWRDSLVFDAHLDVVGAGVARTVEERDGRLYGPGVADNVAAVAMLAHLSRQIAAGHLVCGAPMRIVFSVCEEGLGNLAGVRRIVADHPEPPHLFVAWDLSYDVYSTSSVGSQRYQLHIDGDGGHSWNDFGNPNAAQELVRLLAAVQTEYHRFYATLEDTLTFNIGTIAAGEGINSLAREARASFEFRGLTQQALTAMEVRLRRVLEAADPRVRVALKTIGSRPAAKSTLSTTTRAFIADLLKQVGIPAQDVPRSTNINIPLAAGWPAVCLGCCKSGSFHRPDEYLELASLKYGWRLMTALAAGCP